MITYKIDWESFKKELINRDLLPQWIDSNGSYYIYASDGFLMISCEITQSETQSADQLDFEANYKENWNRRLEHRDKNGLTRVYTSPRIENTTTYFTGSGDNGGVGSGSRVIFKLTSDDLSKSKTLIFNEPVNIKDGIITTENAPFGSSIDVDILDPEDNVVLRFAKTINLLGDGIVYLNSEDSEQIFTGLKVKITVKNSDPNRDPDEDSPTDFKVVGNIEMYRKNTI